VIRKRFADQEVNAMAKIFGTAGALASILVGAIVWVVLDVIIGIPAWISFVAGGGVALLGVGLALGIGAQAATKHSHGPHGTIGAH
jgi:phosphate/sulfate permease